MCLGIFGQIVQIIDVFKLMVMVDVLGVCCEVNIVCVVGGDFVDFVGCWMFIYVGFVMSLIDEDEVEKMFEVLCGFGEVQEILEVMVQGDVVLEVG